MDKELDSLQQHDVAELISPDSVSSDSSVISTRWVYKVKADGRFKARLVVQGWGQWHGIDRGATYAPVCRIGSQRLTTIGHCGGKGLERRTDGCPNCVSPEPGDRRRKQPPGFTRVDPVTGKTLIMKLKRSLYGLRQSPRNWNQTFHRALLEIGFEATQNKVFARYGTNVLIRNEPGFIHDWPRRDVVSVSRYQ